MVGLAESRNVSSVGLNALITMRNFARNAHIKETEVSTGRDKMLVILVFIFGLRKNLDLQTNANFAVNLKTIIEKYIGQTKVGNINEFFLTGCVCASTAIVHMIEGNSSLCRLSSISKHGKEP